MKTKLSVDSVGVREDRIKLESDLNILQTISKDASALTEGTVKKADLEAVNKYLLEKTGFANPEFSAESIGKKSAYMRLKLNSHIDNKYIEFTGETYEAIKDVFEVIKEDHTSYLSPKHQKEFNKLEKIVNLLNEEGLSGNCIDRLPTGKWQVNAFRLNNKSFRM